MTKHFEELKKEIYRKNLLLQFLIQSNSSEDRVRDTKLELDGLLYKYIKFLKWNSFTSTSLDSDLKNADL